VHGYWLKYKEGDDPTVRYDHRGSVWRNESIIYYGGTFRSVDDATDMWAINVTEIAAGSLVKADAEGRLRHERVMGRKYVRIELPYLTFPFMTSRAPSLLL